MPDAMTPSVNLCLVLHNHQPIGNFEGVFEQAYQESYAPFLDVFEPFESLAISLHTSGPLMQWIADRHPEYIDRLRLLIDAGRVEILGGPIYEPILTMLPSRDRIGQIVAHTAWIEQHLGCRVTGMWTPERVWEPSLTADIAAAGIGYTVLDDGHFHAAGLTDNDLRGYFVTEDAGQIIRIFPGSERLRYTIPFAEVAETIDFCWQVAQQHPGAVLTFGDDGEKFGSWPETHDHVYRDGWLKSFFQALVENAGWLKSRTLASVVAQTSAAGKVYLPAGSYREMTRWALPTIRQQELEAATEAVADSELFEPLRPFIRGGFWSNFRVKYGESNEMYARMIGVSKKLLAAEEAGADPSELALARDHLYRGQCNCAYWHGTFGGVYLPHLRNAIFEHLIRADTLLDTAIAKLGQQHPVAAPFVTASSDDYDFDLMQEVRLDNESYSLWVAPGHGGRLYEWDLKRIGVNLLASMQRRPEPYHSAAADGVSAAAADAAVYDRFPRKSLMDHFWDPRVTLADVADGVAMERGDFVDLPYTAKLRRGTDRVQLQMRRDGNAWGLPVTITKAVTLLAGSDELTVTYLLEHLPTDRELHFAVEMNFAAMPAGADDRYFSDADGQKLGQLGERIDLEAADRLALNDQWLGLTVDLRLDRQSGIWAFPVETYSQSVDGFEPIHQSVCVMPHWSVRGDSAGRWAVQMTVRSAVAASGHVTEPRVRGLEVVG